MSPGGVISEVPECATSAFGETSRAGRLGTATNGCSSQAPRSGGYLHSRDVAGEKIAAPRGYGHAGTRPNDRRRADDAVQALYTTDRDEAGYEHVDRRLPRSSDDAALDLLAETRATREGDATGSGRPPRYQTSGTGRCPRSWIRRPGISSGSRRRRVRGPSRPPSPARFPKSQGGTLGDFRDDALPPSPSTALLPRRQLILFESTHTAPAPTAADTTPVQRDLLSNRVRASGTPRDGRCTGLAHGVRGRAATPVTAATTAASMDDVAAATDGHAATAAVDFIVTFFFFFLVFSSDVINKRI